MDFEYDSGFGSFGGGLRGGLGGLRGRGRGVEAGFGGRGLGFGPRGRGGFADFGNGGGRGFGGDRGFNPRGRGRGEFGPRGRGGFTGMGGFDGGGGFNGGGDLNVRGGLNGRGRGGFNTGGEFNEGGNWGDFGEGDEWGDFGGPGPMGGGGGPMGRGGSMGCGPMGGGPMGGGMAMRGGGPMGGGPMRGLGPMRGGGPMGGPSLLRGGFRGRGEGFPGPMLRGRGRGDFDNMGFTLGGSRGRGDRGRGLDMGRGGPRGRGASQGRGAPMVRGRGGISAALAASKGALPQATDNNKQSEPKPLMEVQTDTVGEEATATDVDKSNKDASINSNDDQKTVESETSAVATNANIPQRNFFSRVNVNFASKAPVVSTETPATVTAPVKEAVKETPATEKADPLVKTQTETQMTVQEMNEKMSWILRGMPATQWVISECRKRDWFLQNSENVGNTPQGKFLFSLQAKGIVGTASGKNKKDAKLNAFNVMAVKLAAFFQLINNSAAKFVEKNFQSVNFTFNPHRPPLIKPKPVVSVVATPVPAKPVQSVAALTNPAANIPASTATTPPASQIISFPPNLLAQIDKTELKDRHPTTWLTERSKKMKYSPPIFQEVPNLQPTNRFRPSIFEIKVKVTVTPGVVQYYSGKASNKKDAKSNCSMTAFAHITKQLSPDPPPSTAPATKPSTVPPTTAVPTTAVAHTIAPTTPARPTIPAATPVAQRIPTLATPTPKLTPAMMTPTRVPAPVVCSAPSLAPVQKIPVISSSTLYAAPSNSAAPTGSNLYSDLPPSKSPADSTSGRTSFVVTPTQTLIPSKLALKKVQPKPMTESKSSQSPGTNLSASPKTVPTASVAPVVKVNLLKRPASAAESTPPVDQAPESNKAGGSLGKKDEEKSRRQKARGRSRSRSRRKSSSSSSSSSDSEDEKRKKKRGSSDSSDDRRRKSSNRRSKRSRSRSGTPRKKRRSSSFERSRRSSSFERSRRRDRSSSGETRKKKYRTPSYERRRSRSYDRKDRTYEKSYSYDKKERISQRRDYDKESRGKPSQPRNNSPVFSEADPPPKRDYYDRRHSGDYGYDYKKSGSGHYDDKYSRRDYDKHESRDKYDKRSYDKSGPYDKRDYDSRDYERGRDYGSYDKRDYDGRDKYERGSKYEKGYPDEYYDDKYGEGSGYKSGRKYSESYKY